MPVSFILIGLLIIYIFFYGNNVPYKNIFVFLLSTILIGYFITEVNILHGVLVNVFIAIPVFIINTYFIVKLEKLEGIIFVISVILSCVIYGLLVSVELEFSTLFTPLYIFIITSVVAIIFSLKQNLCFAYIISSFTLYDLLNIILVKNGTGVVSILSVTTTQLIVYSLLISLIFAKLFTVVIKKYSKEKANV